MIEFRSSGSFDKTEKFLQRNLSPNIAAQIDKFGAQGVQYLSIVTPKDTGTTAQAWKYRIVAKRNMVSIEWYNTNVNDGRIIAVLIQYGHGTKDGHWVEGRDFINPAMRPVFDDISYEVWKEVTR